MAPWNKLPFTSRKGPITNGVVPIDENARPEAIGKDVPIRPSLALDRKESVKEPNEFKMSSVNDSGVYLPVSRSCIIMCAGNSDFFN